MPSENVVSNEVEEAVRATYRAILTGWNAQDAAAFAAPFADDGEVIGFDGSRVVGRAQIEAEMAGIFADHPTGSYVGIARRVRQLGPHVAILHAVSGVVPAGADAINPDLNAIQSLVAQRQADGWRVILYQNTPAAFHGRPELAEELTAELTTKLRAGR
jgi:uncharacterized protein (TIGR02246 family)